MPDTFTKKSDDREFTLQVDGKLPTWHIQPRTDSTNNFYIYGQVKDGHLSADSSGDTEIIDVDYDAHEGKYAFKLHNGDAIDDQPANNWARAALTGGIKFLRSMPGNVKDLPMPVYAANGVKIDGKDLTYIENGKTVNGNFSGTIDVSDGDNSVAKLVYKDGALVKFGDHEGDNITADEKTKAGTIFDATKDTRAVATEEAPQPPKRNYPDTTSPETHTGAHGEEPKVIHFHKPTPDVPGKPHRGVLKVETAQGAGALDAYERVTRGENIPPAAAEDLLKNHSHIKWNGRGGPERVLDKPSVGM